MSADGAATRRTVDGPTRSVFAQVLLGLIALYQRTVAWRTPRCRFTPTCSSYAATAIATHGAWRGSGLAARRLGRCHPWHPGGLDPVPPPRDRGRGREEIA